MSILPVHQSTSIDQIEARALAAHVRTLDNPAMGLFGSKDHDVIHVQFFDHATGKAFAESHVPAGQLPESFEASTTLHLGEADWRVIEARPITAAEYRRTGKLVLILGKVSKGFVDASTILYSLPTITNDALPPIIAGSSKLGANIIEIHEDDWRQIEWIGAAEADVIESELTSIRRIYEEERQGVGFRKCHLRCSIPMPLANQNIRVDELRAEIGPKAMWLPGIGYYDVAGVAENSFAVRLISSIEMFGVAPSGIIESVCFANIRTNNVPEPDLHSLARFAAAHDLLLVDWCRAAVVQPSHEEYAAYFLGTGS